MPGARATAQTAALLDVVINAPVPIFMKDAEGRYIYVNNSYTEAIGIPLDEIMRVTDFDLYPVHVATAYHQNDLEAIHARTPIQREEPFARNGDERTFSVVRFPIFNDRNEIAGVCGISVDITDSLRAEQARSDERARLTAELHDDAVQVMATVALRLENLEREAVAQEGARLADLRKMVSDALQRLRALISDMQVSESTELDLRASLEEILQSIERDHSVSFSLEDHLLDQPHSLLAVGLHRIAREALVNVTKHAQASHVDVTVTRLNGGIQITIADDGIGFGVGEVRGPEHIGISTMEARAHAMAGELQIHSRVGAGTRVEVWVPDPSQRRTSNAE